MIAAFLAIVPGGLVSHNFMRPMRRAGAPCLIRQSLATAPTFKVSRIAADVVGCFLRLFCVRWCSSSFGRVRLRGDGENKSLRLPRLRGSQMFWSATVPGADTFRSALWHQPPPTCPRHTLAHTAKNLLPRRVRSDESRALRQGGFAVFPAVSSRLPFPFRGSETRLIFPVAKVGLTVHRKIDPTGFPHNFL